MGGPSREGKPGAMKLPLCMANRHTSAHVVRGGHLATAVVRGTGPACWRISTAWSRRMAYACQQRQTRQIRISHEGYSTGRRTCSVRLSVQILGLYMVRRSDGHWTLDQLLPARFAQLCAAFGFDSFHTQPLPFGMAEPPFFSRALGSLRSEALLS